MRKTPINQVISVNGEEMINLSPDLNDRKKAIVDLAVIKRLAKLLPKADARDIISNMRERLRDIYTLEDYVEILKDEVAFHESVNLINEVEVTETAVEEVH